ncbi:MAG: hypothetical protein ACJ8AI_09645, partial [Rhodopila sp.]
IGTAGLREENHMHDHWRDKIKVHPAADLFPMMSDAELDALANDIAEHGMHQGIVLWTPEWTITAISLRCAPRGRKIAPKVR